MRDRLTTEQSRQSVLFCEWIEAHFPIDSIDAGTITLKAQQAFLFVRKLPQGASIPRNSPRARQRAS